MASSPTLAIVGGERANQPWVVQTFGLTSDMMDYTYCSGVAINELMVVTAKHCNVSLVVFHSAKDSTQFQQSMVASTHPVEGTDLQVVVLQTAHRLASYPQLAPDYLAKNNPLPPGTLGTLYAYGGDGSAFMDEQKSLDVKVFTHHKNKLLNEALVVQGLNGQTEGGDSGGPLIINDMLVGILSADFTHRGVLFSEFQGLAPALSTIRQLEHAREMRSASENPVALLPISNVKVENSAVSVTISSELINSGKQIVVWVNGRYLGEVNKNGAYYATRENINGGAIYRMGGFRVNDTDIVQIGIVTGANNPQAAKLLYEKVPGGVEDVSINGGQLSVKMSTQLINSGHKIGIWVNGAYHGQVQNNSAYSLSRQDVTGGTIFKTGGVQYGDLVQIGVFTNINSPAASVLLYSGRLSGIQDVVRNGKRFDVHISPDMFNAPIRLVTWVNGVYSSEFYNGVNYYGARQPYSVGGLVRIPSAFVTGTPTVQVGIVPGKTGDSYGTPRTSKLLYSGNPAVDD
ncbi:hypothetical protein GCM10017655_45250 [Pseudomonas turukhanskensis]|uniref:Peptidase S1 domain-containing protein n=1 Tax=Pseudomonas turukhanskensis TaxID=1806536 RepID=A0A9W6KAY7_9PSED|nr:hypothetical protein GCM10017655_45250 [Pseudomonas turukhanskensis]